MRYGLPLSIVATLALAVSLPSSATAECGAGAIRRHFTGEGCVGLNGISCEIEAFYCTTSEGGGQEYQGTSNPAYDACPSQHYCTGGCNGRCPVDYWAPGLGSPPYTDLACQPAGCSTTSTSSGCYLDGCPVAPDPQQPQCKCDHAACDKPTCVGDIPTAKCPAGSVNTFDTEEICGDGVDNNCDGQADEDCEPPDDKQPVAGGLPAETCANLEPKNVNTAGEDPIQLDTRAAVTTPFTDFSAGAIVDLGITRTYSSADTSVRGSSSGGTFGRGWHHDWEATLTCANAQHCRVTQGVSETMSFEYSTSASGLGAASGETWDVYRRSDSRDVTIRDRSILVRRPGGEFVLYRMDGREFHFVSDCGHDYCSSSSNFCKDPTTGGKAHLSAVVDARGNVTHVQYDRPNGVLLSLSDDLGHKLELRASGNACSTGLARSLTYDGVTLLTYEYGGDGRELTMVREWTPDGRGAIVRSYEYGYPGNSHAGYLVKIRNESGDPIVEFGYDSSGYATSLVDSSSTVAVSYADRSTLTVRKAASGRSSTTSRRSRSRGAGLTLMDSFVYARIAAKTRCSEDGEGRAHYFHRDSGGRVTRHTMYAPGTYSCSSPFGPSESIVPVLDEWFEYGLRREVASGVYVDLSTVTATTRRSIFGDGLSSGSTQTTNLTETRLDFDPQPKAGDPSGYQCSVTGEAVSGVPCREVESGYTLDEQGAIVPEVHTTYYSYDGHGRVVRTVGPMVSDGAVVADSITPVEERSYWPESGSQGELPRLGRLREIRRYAGVGGVVLTTSFDYDLFGPYLITDPGGQSTVLVKDGRGRVVAVGTPGGRVVSLRYYDGTAPRLVLKGSGGALRYQYDAKGRVVLLESLSGDPEASNPALSGNGVTVGWRESRQYDSAGNAIVIERTDADGTLRSRQVREYDSDHHLLNATHPEAADRLARWAYDRSWSPTSYTDEEDRTIRLLRDAMGRLSVVRRIGVAADGSEVSQDAAAYVYEPERELIASVTDGAGHATSYRHDDFGRVLTVESPSTQVGPVRYRYDARGNVVRRSWGSTTALYRYDGLSRLVRIDATSTAGAPAVTEVFRYDEDAATLGRLTSIEVDGRTTRYAYDEDGQLRFETVSGSQLSTPLITEYRYDADGQLDTLVYPSGLAVKYDRDPATGAVAAVRNLAAGTSYATGIRYLPWGPLRNLDLGDGSSLSQTFNLRYEPLSISSGPVVLGYVPTPAGDIASISSPTGSESFSYDVADRLVTRRATTGIRADPLRYVYDQGRLVQARAGDTSIPRHAYGYDDQANVSAVSAYDEQGAAVTSTICLVHDALGRLVLVGYAAPGTGGPGALACRGEAEVRQVIARFAYDAFNRRIARQGPDGQWTHFAFGPGSLLLGEYTRTDSAMSPAREYVWLGDRPLTQVEYPGAVAGAEVFAYYFHVDHLGTPRALTSSTGQTVWANVGLPYGEVLESTVPDARNGRTVVTNLRLPGQYDERLLGLLGLQGPYYNWNRWYLPGVGRYLEADPIALGGGFNSFFGPDWYGYAAQNPLSYWDPDGRLGGSRIFKALVLVWHFWMHKDFPKPPKIPEPQRQCQVGPPPPPPDPPPLPPFKKRPICDTGVCIDEAGNPVNAPFGGPLGVPWVDLPTGPVWSPSGGPIVQPGQVPVPAL